MVLGSTNCLAGSAKDVVLSGKTITGDPVYFGGRGVTIKDCKFHDQPVQSIIGGIPGGSWDHLDQGVVRDGEIRNCEFRNIGKDGADEGVVYFQKSQTGDVELVNLYFKNCKNAACLYFDDIFSGHTQIYNILAEDCDQVLLIGGGRGFEIGHVTEIRSKRQSVIDNRGQVPWVQGGRGCKFPCPVWDQITAEYKCMGLPVPDLATIGPGFNTSGSIRNWRSIDCGFNGPQFLDGAEKFWTVSQ
jgi:hypothetical protein